MAKHILFALLAAALSLPAQAQTGLKPPAEISKPKASAKAAPKPAADEENLGVKAVERIFACVAEGLPKEWRRAWVIVTEIAGDGKERSFEGKFFYSLDAGGAKPAELVPCDARRAAQGVYELNDFLEPEKRGWKVATLIFLSDGKFELKYDYAK